MMPYLKENYAIDSFLNDEAKNNLLKEALKVEAEKLKINLSFAETYDVISDVDEYPEDDNGEEIELDFTVTNEKLKAALVPVFQKAVDISKELLAKNNLNGNTIGDLILVGGPTFSPILRELLENQNLHTKYQSRSNDGVARGAAIYAMQFDIDDAIQEEVKDKTKLQLELSYEAQSVEVDEMLVIKLDKTNTEGEVPERLFTEVSDLMEGGKVINLNLVNQEMLLN